MTERKNKNEKKKMSTNLRKKVRAKGVNNNKSSNYELNYEDNN